MALDLTNVRAAVRHEGGISRRLLLAYGAALAGLPALASRAAGAPTTRPSFPANPFALGVASGDPDAGGVVLWTKLAPRPLDPDGGMPNDAVDVRWEVAEDEAMRTVVKSGTTRATAQLGHTVHVEVEGLRADRWYWYRFRAGDAESPIGRTRTLPDASATPDRLRFAFASCQHFETGLFTAYQQMAKDDLDFVFHLGDYIYEGAGRDDQVRKHAGPKLASLADYRLRYAQYRADPLLHGMHARCPWFITPDDHEVENDYAGAHSQRRDADPAAFLEQRAHAYQAYYEMMPFRRRSLPHGPDIQLYRRAAFGRLAELLILDTRQYRTAQPNNDQAADLNDAALAPSQTIMGAKQRRWLEEALRTSRGTWNVLAQQVMMAMVDTADGPSHRYSMDKWTGYTHERMALVQFMADRRIANPVVITGDIHSNWVNDLRVDDRKPEMPIVATEFVGTSISSSGNGMDRPPNYDALLAENPGVRFHNRQRGYVRCTLRPVSWQSDYVVVEDVQQPGGRTFTRASFVVEAGKPGAKPA